MKDELQNTKIAITCYDKDGNIVKRVTSADTNDVEDPDGEDNNGGSTGGENTGSGSGSGTGTITPSGGDNGGTNTGVNSGGNNGDPDPDDPNSD